MHVGCRTTAYRCLTVVKNGIRVRHLQCDQCWGRNDLALRENGQFGERVSLSTKSAGELGSTLVCSSLTTALFMLTSRQNFKALECPKILLHSPWGYYEAQRILWQALAKLFGLDFNVARVPLCGIALTGDVPLSL